MVPPVRAEPVEAWLEAVRDALPHVILSADHDRHMSDHREPRRRASGGASRRTRRNLGVGRGVNGIHTAATPAGGT